MSINPFSIYVRTRPLRTAFLVDPYSVSPQQLDAIFEYNLTRWGGRLNPIIFSDGARISDEWWRFLIGFDPDVIVPTISLGAELKDQIARRVAPSSIEDYHELDVGTRFSIHTWLDGLSVYPDPESLASLAFWIRIGPATLVVFDLDATQDAILKRFLATNFGVYPKTIFMDSVLEGLDVATFEITDRESLRRAIEELSSPVPRGWVYPRQFSMIAKTWPRVAWNYGRDAFTVIVGDSVDDVTHFWNHPVTMAASKRKGINEIWLPRELAGDPQLREVLPRWFRKLSTSDQPIRFATYSLGEEDLQSEVDNLTPKNEFYPTQVSLLTAPQTPDFENASPYVGFIKTPDMSWHTGSGGKTVLSIDGPPAARSSTGIWVSDIHIQYDAEELGYYSTKDRMWQLPRKNHIIWQILQAEYHVNEGRVNSGHYPSVLMSGPRISLGVHLPTELSLFCELITQQPSRFTYAKPSEKGRYLAGIIKLFSGLFQTYFVLQERYWRLVFEEMAIRETRDAEAAPNKIRKLIKKLKSGQKIDDDHVISLLLDAARRGARKGTDFFFEDFEAKARDWGENIECLHLDWRIQSFINSNVLRIGLTPKCTRCGYRDWYPIGDVRQAIECSGCGFSFPLRIGDERWVYRLNSLVRAGVAQHGSIPVILTLGQLLRDSRQSFIFAPSLDLFEDQEKMWGDLDLVCIQDGKFIIGEVKSSVTLFDLDDFDKMEYVAKSLLPDVLVFSVEKGDINKRPSLAQRFDQLRDELSLEGVEVRWLSVGSEERGILSVT